MEKIFTVIFEACFLNCMVNHSILVDKINMITMNKFADVITCEETADKYIIKINDVNIVFNTINVNKSRLIKSITIN